MPVSANTLRLLMAAGLSGEPLLEVVSSIDADNAQKKSAGAIRQERYRHRHASQSVTSDVTSDVTDDTLSSPEVSPQTPLPNPINPNTPSPPKGGSVPVGFDEFWSAYPHKVGKADAVKAFGRALKRVGLSDLLDGLSLYAAKTDDRPWCNPATWLNQDRWLDRPAQQPRGSPSRPRTTQDAAADLLRRMQSAHHEPDQGNSADQPLAIGFSGNG